MKEDGTLEAIDMEAAVSIVRDHVESDKVGIRSGEEVLSIQFHDMPDSFGAILTELTDQSFSFDVSGGFEVPPLVHVTARDPTHEPHGDDSGPTALQGHISEAEAVHILKGGEVEVPAVDINGDSYPVYVEIDPDLDRPAPSN